MDAQMTIGIARPPACRKGQSAPALAFYRSLDNKLNNHLAVMSQSSI